MTDGMVLVEKVLWLVESRLDRDTSLGEIADAAGVSRFHLSRTFGAVTGHSVMNYVRARRLSEAARRLAGGAPDILRIALEAGYGSHEAFTRAFREQFGLTPESVRREGHMCGIALVEPFAIPAEPTVELFSPRIEAAPPLLIAGLTERYTFETNHSIPLQWRRFHPYVGHVATQIGGTTYGVCCNSDGQGRFDYVTGVEVASFADLPREFARVRVAAHRYAAFPHRGHISTLRRTVRAVWGRWLPQSGHALCDSPDFERYSSDFDAERSLGTVEIWLPIEQEVLP
jgi:AraC family transcriptional regulator